MQGYGFCVGFLWAVIYRGDLLQICYRYLFVCLIICLAHYLFILLLALFTCLPFLFGIGERRLMQGLCFDLL